MTDDDGWTALHYSARKGCYESLKFLADVGNDIYQNSHHGRNSLHIAALFGHLNLCKILIDKHNFDVHMADNKGWAALHHSARCGNYELFRYFADIGADIYLKNNDGWNCLHIAAHYGHLSLCKTFIDRHNFDVHMTDNKGWEALHHSARYGSYELFRYFADIGADIYIKNSDDWNCLHIAAHYGHLNFCKMLTDKHNFDFHMVDNKGWAVLHNSARCGSYELFRYFTDIGADIYLKNNDGRNCLHIAAQHGHSNLCKILIDKHKFDVHMVDNKGWSAFHLSARYGSYKLFRYFADIGADIYLKSYDGTNCLHIAAFNGHLNLSKILINKYNFNVHITDNDGWSALHNSVRYGSYELFRYFANIGADIYIKNNGGWNCLHIAAQHGHLNLCKILIDKHNFDVYMADNDGWVALHHSARYGSYELFRYFVEIGTDIYLKNNDDWNCLHIAVLQGHLKLSSILINKYKFDIHMVDNKGWSALHHSARYGSYELFRYFANMGADIYLKSNDDRNCLHIAAFNGHLDLCKILIHKHNFDVHAVDNNGWAALHNSAKYGSYELLRYFADIGTNIYLKDNDDWNCLHIAAHYGHLNLCKIFLDKYNFDVHMADKIGWTVLHHSARFGSYELFRYFADRGADIYLKSHDGTNCLHIAAQYGHLNLCKLVIEKHNFDVHMPNNNGWTALHHSAIYGCYKLFRYLAKAGADIYLKNNDGWNCLHIAARKGHLNLCNIFISKHNFDVHMVDNKGWAALHHSVICGSYELFSYFCDMGADIYLKSHNGWNCLHIAALYGHLKLCKIFVDKHNFDIHMTTNNDWTTLHCSAQNGSFELFSYFVDKKPEIYCKTKKMKNILHLSSREGHFNICEFVLKYFTKDYRDNNSRKQHTLNGKSYRSQIFYKYHTIFLHAMDDEGNTYLHLAAEGNHAKVCELLLRYDTEIITLLNKKEKTAMEIAADNGHGDVLNALKAEYERKGILFYSFYTFFYSFLYK